MQKVLLAIGFAFRQFIAIRPFILIVQRIESLAYDLSYSPGGLNTFTLVKDALRAGFCRINLIPDSKFNSTYSTRKVYKELPERQCCVL